MPSLETIWSLSLFDRYARHAEFVTDIVMHPSGSVAVVSCYIGKLKVLHFKDGVIHRDFDVMYAPVPLLVSNAEHDITGCQS